MKAFGTSKWGLDIKEKEVVRETDSCFFFTNWKGKEEKFLKVTGYEVWHNSKEKAVKWLITRTELNIKLRNEEILKLNSDLEKLSKL